MNIIFLDVDGVLNSYAYFQEIKARNSHVNTDEQIRDYHLQLLAKIYHKCDAKIVLSSTWRELADLTDSKAATAMYKYLTDSLARYGMEIYDRTPIIKFDRPLEINTWLQGHADLGEINYVSLDDDCDADEYKVYGMEDHLVHTTYWDDDINESGLQEKHVKQAIKILRGDNK